MPKLITKEICDAVLKLRFEQNLSFTEIARQVGLGRNKVAEICGNEEASRADREMEEDRKREREQSAHKIEPEVFARLDNGENPVDLVKAGVCSIDAAEEFGKEYTKLKNMSRPEIEILEARVENASYALRHALGVGKIKICCPLCHGWAQLTLREVDGSQRWVCGNCGRVPF